MASQIDWIKEQMKPNGVKGNDLSTFLLTDNNVPGSVCRAERRQSRVGKSSF